MSSSRETLERIGARVPVPQPAFDRLMRRRSRKQRTRRIGTVVFALLLAVAAVGGVVQIFRSAERPTPANQQITPDDVNDLMLAWKGPSNGTLVSPVVSNGVVYVASYGYEYGGGNAAKHSKDGRIYAFPTGCAAGGTTCRPLWYGETRKPAIPLVLGDAVYALTSFRGQTGELFSFPVGCAADGSACAPSWTATIGASTGLLPVVIGDRVYVGSSRGVFAFAADCGASGATCEPIWKVRTDHPVSALATVGNTLLVGTRSRFSFSDPGTTVDVGAVYAFPASCSHCEPIWVDRSVGQVWQSGIRVEGSTILVGTNGGQFGRSALLALPTSCATVGGPCQVLWTADLHGVCCTQIATTADQVFAEDYLGLFAFPIDCRTDGGTCQPTWTSNLGGALVTTPGPLIEFGPPVVADGVVFVGAGLNSGAVYAFQTDCTGSCKPIWTGTAGTGAYDALVDGDHLLVAGEDGLYAFAPRAGLPAPPAPSGRVPVFYAALAAIAVAWAVWRKRRRA